MVRLKSMQNINWQKQNYMILILIQKAFMNNRQEVYHCVIHLLSLFVDYGFFMILRRITLPM